MPTLDFYPVKLHDHLTVSRPSNKTDGIWIHPGEPVFEQFRSIVSDRLKSEAARGAVFVDPNCERPYLFHLALVSVVREADPQVPEFNAAAAIECRLVGVKQFEGSELQVCPVEHLLLLKGGEGLPPAAQRLALAAPGYRDQASAFIAERVGRQLAIDRKNLLLSTLEEREGFLRRGFSYQEAEFAAARAKHAEKARTGNRAAAKELEETKRAQRELTSRREHALAVIRREPDLVRLAPIQLLAHALVVPSSDPLDRERHDADVEQVAMQIAWAWEESEGAIVKDVHTPELARQAGLPDYPGFDLLSVRPSGEKRGIEVKGRGTTGDVELFSNEWAKACNMGPSYWLYVVYDCATPKPRRARVRDPFNRLLAKAKGSILLSAKQILDAEGDD